ncbi:MAG: glycosyltransferase family 4 protein [Planctomycetes bacterium]|nr:glycosyltransferase family 4 protein [Planctomycetota bacterium]
MQRLGETQLSPEPLRVDATPEFSHGLSHRRIRVALMQPSLPHYRLAAYAELASRPTLDFTLHYSTRQDIRNSEPKGFKAVHKAVTWNWRSSTLLWHQDDLRVARSRRFDVVIYPWTTRQMSLLPAIMAARRAGVGVVLWGQGVSKFENAARLSLRLWLARRADAVVTYNRAVAENLVRLGFPREDVFAAVNSLDQRETTYWREECRRDTVRVRHFKETNRLKDKTVLFVSRLHYPNRIDVLIEAAALLAPQMPDLRVVLVGAGEARESLEALVRRKNLDSICTFTGALYGEEQTAPWFAASDVFCYPSNAGLSLLHAQGHGIPLVLGDQLGAHNPEIESFQDGVNGRSFRHNDPADLARVLREMLNDRAALKRMGEAGIRNMQENFTIPRMVDGLEGAIVRAYEKSRRTSR